MLQKILLYFVLCLVKAELEIGNDEIAYNGYTLLKLAPIYVHLFNSTSNNTKTGTLIPLRHFKSVGTDTIGKYSSSSVEWNNRMWPQDQVYFKTHIKLYPKQSAIVFEQEYPAGTQGCDSLTSSQLRATFPNFYVQNTSYYSYHGVFLMHHETGRFDKQTNLADGVELGPMILFKPDHSMNVIISHFNEFMTQTVRYNRFESQLQYGPMGSLCNLPNGYTAKSIFVFDKDSIISSSKKWGDILMKNRKRKVDYTTRYLGYSTDNGAYYYYQTENGTKTMEETMYQILEDAKTHSIPYKYWLLDSWWYYQDSRTHGVSNWTARLDIFPNGMDKLFRDTNMYVQAHNRYWSPKSDYDTKYQFIHSLNNKTSLPVGRQFWLDLFHSGFSWGLKVYEQDWLNKQFEDLSQAYTDPTLMRKWLLDMGQAASECDLTIQYCMPLGRHLLQSTEIESVSQIRASNDYVNELQWNIGISSLLHWSLQLKPSKDSAWSKMEQPGNRYHRKELYPEFQTVIMALSTGPVTFADRINFSNVKRIKRTCRKDGLLLQPIQPLVVINEWFYQQSVDNKFGHIQESKMKMGDLPIYYIVLALELKVSFMLSPLHLHKFDHRLQYIYYSYEYNYADSAQDEIFHLRLGALSSSSNLKLLASKAGNPSDYQLYYIAPIVFESRWVILGELSKIVPISEDRIQCPTYDISRDEIHCAISGSSNEKVSLYFGYYILPSKPLIKKFQLELDENGKYDLLITKQEFITDWSYPLIEYEWIYNDDALAAVERRK